MSHELEMVNGEASMAYARDADDKFNDVPWHGLGKEVPPDLTPAQMCEAAGLDWRVETIPAFVEINGKKVEINRQALIRDRDQKILSVISDDWNPCQNEEAFNFFNDFIAAGDMEMSTAGSLKDGRIIWAMAKIKDSGFELFGGRDRIDAYMLFTNPHQYGQSIDIRSSGLRVVCNNTLTMALNVKSKSVVKVNHRRKLDMEQVKLALGISAEKLQTYKEACEFISKKRYKNEDVVDYFKRIFPLNSSDPKKENELSRNAKLCIDDFLHSQPGVEFGEGTFYSLMNTVTYATNHELGRSADSRLASTWYGSNKNLNIKALQTAVEMAEAV